MRIPSWPVSAASRHIQQHARQKNLGPGTSCVKNIRRMLLASAAAIAFGAAAPQQAAAEALNFEPIMLEFAQGQRAATLNITNRGLQPTTVQIRAFSWTQNADNDQLTPTDDIILSPPEAPIAPGATQVIRLLLRAPAGPAEQHYRLMVDQLSSPIIGTISITLHVSLPVILDGAVTKPLPLQWHVDAVVGHKLTIAAYNPGASFQRVSYLDADLPDGQKLTPRVAGNNPFVLPGMTRHWVVVLPPTAPPAGQIGLTAHFGTKTQETSLAYAP